MAGARGSDGDARAAARAWTQRARVRFCDSQRWEHGVVVRAGRLSRYFDLNVLRVEGDPRLGVDALIDVCDHALADLDHRRIDFDEASVAEPLRAEFRRQGFRSTRLVLMRFDGAPSPPTSFPVVEVDYDAVRELRRVWHQEDFPGLDDAQFEAQAREVRLALGTRTLAAYEDGQLIAYAALDVGDREIEIGALYVLPEHRGHGVGTALTLAAIAASDRPENLWICADDEDRPKQLYARLGFRPVITWTEFLRPPNQASQ